MLRMAGELVRKKCRLYRKNESGVTVIEFAFLAPLFFLILFVMIETGLMLFTEYVLQTSVQEAARAVRTGQAQEQKWSANQFKERVCRLAKGIINCESKVTVYMNAEANFTTLAAGSPGYTSVGKKVDGTTDPMPFDCGLPNEAVSLIATYDWEFATPLFMHYFGNINGGDARRLVGFAMFKNEPFPAVAGNVCG